ncbi:hypothetical protein Bpfe_018854, partial [Biomphalaria pfeifferi]
INGQSEVSRQELWQTVEMPEKGVCMGDPIFSTLSFDVENTCIRFREKKTTVIAYI